MMKCNHLRRFLALLMLCAVLAGSLTVPAAAAGFQDVPAGHWAGTEIRRCAELGFFKGKTETQFGLGQSMTRSAFVVVLCRFFGWETPAPSDAAYADVPTDAWYAGAVDAAYTRGALTSQRSNFRPADAITREEMTVMLVRALGYSSLSGLAQEMDCPFEDVTTNAGYITMAYHLGLMNGTSATTFSPEKSATREQVAVIFMRLYDKLHAPAAVKSAFLSPRNFMPDLTGLNEAIIPALHLLRNDEPQHRISEEGAALLRDEAKQAGIPALLCTTADAAVLNHNPDTVAQVLVKAVKSGRYDGLVLDIPAPTADSFAALTRLAAALQAAPEIGQLRVVLDAPAQEEAAATERDFAALGSAVDQLILRIAPYETTAGGIGIAAIEPPEKIYYTISTLKSAVPAEKLSLMVTTTGLSRTRSGASNGSLTTEEILTQLDSGAMTSHYSYRYACPYLHNTGTGETVWYLNEEAAAQRAQLLRLLGAPAVCFADWDTTSAALLNGFC